MATTVGSHAVAQFTSPVNQTSPIDANSVRGNDNTLRTAYVNHDADTGIHVQSSTLASRPVAGVAGRKWITADTGDYHLWYDDGSTWHEVGNSTIEIEVLADANLVAGDVVKVTGYNNGQACPTVNKVASAADVAFGIVDAAIAINTKGYIVNTGTVRDVNTNAHAVGTILYPDTSGGLTATKPTSGNYQVVAYVLRQNTNNGVLYVEFSAPRIVERSDNTASTIVLRDASGNFSAGEGTFASAVVSGDLTVDTSTLFVDSANNRVGIGTASPSARLTVSDANPTVFSVRNTASSVEVQAVASDSNNAFLGTSSNTPLNFLTNNTERMRIDASGNVGIGTASPTLNGGGSSKVIHVNAPNANEWAIAHFTNGSTGTTGSDGLIVGNIGADAYITNYENTPLILSTNATERARIDASGNVGIGVTPQARFHLQGGDFLKTNSDYSAGSTGSGFLISQGASSGNTYTQLVAFQNGNTSYNNIVIPGGSVGIGTASPTDALDVRGVLAAGNGTIKTVISYSTVGIFGTESNHALSLVTNGTERARITSGGALAIGETSPSHQLQVVMASGANRSLFLAGITGVSNGFTVNWDHASGKTHVNIADIPTSASGLPSGTLWNDGGTLKIA